MQRLWTVLSLFALVALGAAHLGRAAETAAKKDGGITVDKDKKTVTVEAKVAPRKLPALDKQYPIEVVACWGHDHQPRGQKAHETIVTIDVKPSDVHKALESLDLKPGKPALGEGPAATGPEVSLFLDVPAPDGSWKRLTMDRVLLDPKTKKPFPKSVKFRFTGSALKQPDPEKDDKVYGADLTGTLIAIYPVTDETVCQSSLTAKEEKVLRLETNTDMLPREGTTVRLVLEVAK